MGLDNAYGVGSLKSGVCTSTTRPASPYEGQVIYETDTDVVRAWNGSSWATIGPTVVPAFPVTAVDAAQIMTGQSTSSTTYTDLATVGPSVTLTTGTRAIVALSAYIGPNGAGTQGAMGFAVSGATTFAAQDGYAAGRWGFSASGGGGVSTWIGLVTLNAGVNTFTAKYKRGSGATGDFYDRNIVVWAI